MDDAVKTVSGTIPRGLDGQSVGLPVLLWLAPSIR
jgi:hypothetical protein